MIHYFLKVVRSYFLPSATIFINREPQTESMEMEDRFKNSILSALSLKTGPNNDSGILMVCNSKSRKISALCPISGQKINEFRFRKNFLNENYPSLCCQLNSSKFLFLESQYFGSNLNDIRLYEHYITVKDFNYYDHQMDDVNKLSLSILENIQICTNSAGYVIIRNRCQQGVFSRLIYIYRVNVDDNPRKEQCLFNSKEFSFKEPECTKLYSTVVCLSPRKKTTNEAKLVYFATDDKSVYTGKLLVANFDYLKCKEDPPNFQNISTYPDPQVGYPPKDFLFYFAGPFVKNDNVYFFHYDQVDQKASMWILKYKYDTLDFTWENRVFTNIPISHFSIDTGTLVINDYGECYWIQLNPNSEYYSVRNLGVIDKPASLKRYAEKGLIHSECKNTCDSRLTLSDTLSRNCEWLYRPSINNNSDNGVTILKLKSFFLEKFCHDILHLKCEDIIKTKTLNGGKLEITFDTCEQQSLFLEQCRKVSDSLNIMAPLIIEIYDNQLQWYENVQPISISLPIDFEIISPQD